MAEKTDSLLQFLQGLKGHAPEPTHQQNCAKQFKWFKNTLIGGIIALGVLCLLFMLCISWLAHERISLTAKGNDSLLDNIPSTSVLWPFLIALALFGTAVAFICWLSFRTYSKSLESALKEDDEINALYRKLYEEGATRSIIYLEKELNKDFEKEKFARKEQDKESEFRHKKELELLKQEDKGLILEALKRVEKATGKEACPTEKS